MWKCGMEGILGMSGNHGKFGKIGKISLILYFLLIHEAMMSKSACAQTHFVRSAKIREKDNK